MTQVTIRLNAFKFLALLVPLFLCGCSWFTWIPGIEERDKKDEDSKLEPAELVDFDSEVDLKRLWKSSVGEGLGKKYLKLFGCLNLVFLLWNIMLVCLKRLAFH